MISWLKKHFIPHEGNDHRPHALRKENIRKVVILVLLLEVFAFFIPTLTYVKRVGTGGLAAVLPALLSMLTNEEREMQKLPALNINPVLTKAAELKAIDMATKGYFAHTSPEGKTPWYWLEKVGYEYQYAGENLAINFSDSKDVTEAWMVSPSHKANIVKGNYTEVGTGIAIGIYEGRESIFVAQLYANPLPLVLRKNEPLKLDVGKTEKITDMIKKEPASILGAETVSTQNTSSNQTENPTLWQRTFASPRNTMNTILFVMFGIIAIALLLYIFIKIKNHHTDLVTNGLIGLAIVGAIFVVNYYFSRHNMIIAENLDYASDSKD